MKAGAHKKEQSFGWEHDFTLLALRDIFETKVKRHPLVTPSDEALETLARVLNGSRHHNLIQNDLTPINKLKQDVKKILAEAIAGLERVKEEQEKFSDAATRAGDNLSASVLRDQIYELQEHIRWAEACRDSNVLQERGVGALWTKLALRLLDCFDEAMRSTNQGFVDNNAAFYRFIEAVAPQLTGEKPPYRSIKQTILRLKKNTS